MVTLTQKQREIIRACSKDTNAFEQIMALLEEVDPKVPAGAFSMQTELAQLDTDQHQAMLDSIGDAVYVVDSTLCLTLFNATFQQISQYLGAQTEITLGLPLEEAFPILPETIYDEYRQIFRTGETHIEEVQPVFNNRQITIEIRKIPIHDGDVVTHIITIMRDITEHEQIEQALRESETKFRSVIEQSYDGVVLVDEDDRIIEWNHGQELITGLRRVDMLGGSLSEILHRLRPASWPNAANDELQLKAYLKNKGGVGFDRFSEVDIRHTDGQIRTLQIATFPIKMEQGKITCAISRDITVKNRVERDLRGQTTLLHAVTYAAEQFLRAPTWENSIEDVLQQLGQTIAVDRVCVFHNHTTAEDRVISSQLYEWLAPGIPSRKDNPQQGAIAWQSCGLGRWESLLCQGQSIAGDIVTFPPQEHEALVQQNVTSLIVVPIFVGAVWWGHIGFSERSRSREWSDGEREVLQIAANTLGAAIERQQAEQQMLDLEIERKRTDILTGFIRDASHEFRTPLSIINMNLHILQNAADVETRQVRADRIQEQVMYINHLVDLLAIMSRLDSGEPFHCEVVALGELCHDTVTPFYAEVEKRDLQLITELADHLPPVWADPDQLQQAVCNILENAIRYTPEGGQIMLRAYPEANQVVVSIRDTGIGISEEALPHVFERFYRVDNAHSTRGLGLGLPIARKIIERMGGHIEIESVLDQGSTFKFYLPTADL